MRVGPGSTAFTVTPLAAIRREILGDEVQLSYSLGRQSLSLGYQ